MVNFNFLILLEKTLIKAMRGNHSQTKINQALSSPDTNIIAKIESGKRRILWSEFCALCHYLKIQLPELFFRQLAYSPLKRGQSLTNDQNILRVLLEHNYHFRFIEMDGWDVSKILACLVGRSRLRLVDVMVLLSKNLKQLVFFCHFLAKDEKLEVCLKNIDGQSLVKIKVDDPLLPLLFAYIDLQTKTQHPLSPSEFDQEFCRLCDLPFAQYQKWIDHQIAEKIIIRDEQSNLRPGIRQYSFNINQEGFYRLSKLFSQKLGAYYEMPTEDRKHKNCVFQFLAVNEKEHEDIIQNVYEFRKKITEISMQAKKNDKSKLLLVQTSFFSS